MLDFDYGESDDEDAGPSNREAGSGPGASAATGGPVGGCVLIELVYAFLWICRMNITNKSNDISILFSIL